MSSDPLESALETRPQDGLGFWSNICSRMSLALVKNNRVLVKATSKWRPRLSAALSKRLELSKRVRADLVRWLHHEMRFRSLSELQTIRISRVLADFDHLICLVEAQAKIQEHG